MCVMIYRPRNVIIGNDVLSKCWTANDDGAGIMWSDGRKLHISKGHMTFGSMCDAIDAVSKNVDLYVHMRIATSGGIRPEMTHPFAVGKHLAIAHNGIISGIGNEKESDTAVLARVMSGLTHDSYKMEEVLDLIDALLQGSRLAILHSDGSSNRLGEWHKYGDLEFSNMLWNRTTYYYGNRDPWSLDVDTVSETPPREKSGDPIKTKCRCSCCGSRIYYWSGSYYCDFCGEDVGHKYSRQNIGDEI